MEVCILQYEAIDEFRRGYEGWEERLSEDDDQIDTLNKLHDAVLNFGNNSSCVVEEISNIFHDVRYKIVNPGHSPGRYLSSLAKLWESNVIDAYFHTDTLNKNNFYRDLKTILPDIYVDNLIFNDTLIRDKPKPYSEEVVLFDSSIAKFDVNENFLNQNKYNGGHIFDRNFARSVSNSVRATSLKQAVNHLYESEYKQIQREAYYPTNNFNFGNIPSRVGQHYQSYSYNILRNNPHVGRSKNLKSNSNEGFIKIPTKVTKSIVDSERGFHNFNFSADIIPSKRQVSSFPNKIKTIPVDIKNKIDHVDLDKENTETLINRALDLEKKARIENLKTHQVEKKPCVRTVNFVQTKPPTMVKSIEIRLPEEIVHHRQDAKLPNINVIKIRPNQKVLHVQRQKNNPFTLPNINLFDMAVNTSMQQHVCNKSKSLHSMFNYINRQKHVAGPLYSNTSPVKSPRSRQVSPTIIADAEDTTSDYFSNDSFEGGTQHQQMVPVNTPLLFDRSLPPSTARSTTRSNDASLTSNRNAKPHTQSGNKDLSSVYVDLPNGVHKPSDEWLAKWGMRKRESSSAESEISLEEVVIKVPEPDENVSDEKANANDNSEQQKKSSRTMAVYKRIGRSKKEQSKNNIQKVEEVENVVETDGINKEEQKSDKETDLAEVSKSTVEHKVKKKMKTKKKKKKKVKETPEENSNETAAYNADLNESFDSDENDGYNPSQPTSENKEAEEKEEESSSEEKQLEEKPSCTCGKVEIDSHSCTSLNEEKAEEDNEHDFEFELSEGEVEEDSSDHNEQSNNEIEENQSESDAAILETERLRHLAEIKRAELEERRTLEDESGNESDRENESDKENDEANEIIESVESPYDEGMNAFGSLSPETTPKVVSPNDVEMEKAKVAQLIEGDVKETEDAMVDEMNETERVVYFEKKRLMNLENENKEKLRKRKLADRLLQEEEERLNQLKQLEALHMKAMARQLFQKELRNGYDDLMLSQRVSRAYTFSYCNLLPFILKECNKKEKKR